MKSNVLPGDGRKVGIIGVPLGYGAGQAGSELGVGAMRLSRMRGGVLSDHIRALGYDVKDYGDVNVIRSLEVTGLAWDVVRVSPERQSRKSAPRGVPAGDMH